MPGIDEHIPEDLRTLYEVKDYRHAAAILRSEFPQQFTDICGSLRELWIDERHVTARGGNESEIPRILSRMLRPLEWKEGKLQAALLVDERTVQADTHKIDYLKGRVALDLEWNSKDQTFDRDLLAFRAFFEYDRLSVGVIVTRSLRLNPVFKRLGMLGKYGASTTHLGKLAPRLDAGRGGGCPILVFGITEALIVGGSNS